MTNGQMILILIAILVCCVISTVFTIIYICQVTKIIIDTIFDASEITTDTQFKLAEKLLGIKEADDERY